MDTQGHQPGEELADFTEGELLSLIDAGTAGAFSEIYRRYINDAVARASASEPGPTAAEARGIADNAFLSVLRSLLNGTADPSKGVRSKVNGAMVELLADLETSNGSSVQDASANDTEESDHALVARAFSTLPDNWQRILWLREVERLSPEAAADKLNIRTTVVERLSNRAHQDLQKEWARTRPKGSKASADHRSALIPALLTSPIVIERLSDTVAQTLPDSAGSPAARAGSISSESTEPVTEPVAEPDLDQATADSPAEAPDAAAKASAAATAAAAAAATSPPTEPAPDDDNAVTGAAVFASADDSSEPAEGDEGTELSKDTGLSEPTSTSALLASAAPAQASTEAPPQSAFSMPKPVLIPVIAACIGLLGTLVGLAVVPQHAEHTGFRSGGEATNVSTVDTASDEDEKSNDSDSPENTDSNRGSRKPGSKNSKASAPAASDQDTNEESSRNPEDDAGRTDDNDPSRDSSDDDGDGSSSRSPDDPGPSDSDRPDSESPSDPTPSEPDSPSEPDEPESPSEPDEPESPSEPDEPESPSEPDPTPPEDPTPTEDPSPSDEPTSDPAPSETNDPSEPEPSQVDPSTGTFTASS